MSTILFMVVEVDPQDRIRCQAPGCHKTVYKRIHVVRDAGRIVVVGSDCWSRLYATAAGSTPQPRHGSNDGRLLTVEERRLLASNTAAFVAHMESEAAASDAREAAAAAEAAQNLRQAAELESQRRREQQRRIGPSDTPWTPPVGSRRTEQSVAGGRNPLEIFRAQQRALAADKAMTRLPALRRFSVIMVEQAMVDARDDCRGRGIKLDDPGSSQLIEARALELLENSTQ